MGYRDGAPETRPSLVPPEAVAEWLALRQALDDAGTVACQTQDPADWWPDHSQLRAPPTHAAVAACRQCRVAVACLAYALAAEERFGIWGGTTPQERRALRWVTDD